MNIRIDEIADRIYRLSAFVPAIGPTGFTFNQYVIDDDQPLVFHTGHRATFTDLAGAIASIIPLERLRWVTFGHVEADECGAMNQLLAAAPRSPGRPRSTRLHGLPKRPGRPATRAPH